MSKAPGVVAGLILVLAVACDGMGNGWGDLRARAAPACEQAKANLRALASTGDSKDDRELREIITSMEPDFAAFCIEGAAEALKPCLDYRYGSDQAIQCAGRYVSPAIELAYYRACAQHATTGTEIQHLCDLEAATRSGDTQRMIALMKTKAPAALAGDQGAKPPKSLKVFKP